MQASSNPQLSVWVRELFFLVALVLLIGAGLLVVPARIAPHWLWPLTPFNARFMGAIYLTELSVVILLLIHNRQSPGRMVLPSALTFVAIISVLTLVYLDHFDLQRRATLAWFVVYFVPTLLLIVFIWIHRRVLAAVRTRLPYPWPALMVIEGVVLLGYALLLLLVPAIATAFWPWPVDAFHARIYSAFFFTLAVAALVVARAAGRLDALTAGIAQCTLGVAVIVGVVVTDISVRRVNWLAVETWLWLAIFAVIGLIGVLLIGISRNWRPEPRP